jgi:hypothetical protein
MQHIITISWGGVRLECTYFIRRPLFGLLYVPQMVDDDECGAVEWELAAETEVLGENRPHCNFIHHKSHMTLPEIELGPPRWEPGD